MGGWGVEGAVSVGCGNQGFKGAVSNGDGVGRGAGGSSWLRLAGRGVRRLPHWF